MAHHVAWWHSGRHWIHGREVIGLIADQVHIHNNFEYILRRYVHCALVLLTPSYMIW